MLRIICLSQISKSNRWCRKLTFTSSNALPHWWCQVGTTTSCILINDSHRPRIRWGRSLSLWRCFASLGWSCLLAALCDIWIQRLVRSLGKRGGHNKFSSCPRSKNWRRNLKPHSYPQKGLLPKIRKNEKNGLTKKYMLLMKACFRLNWMSIDVLSSGIWLKWDNT